MFRDGGLIPDGPRGCAARFAANAQRRCEGLQRDMDELDSAADALAQYFMLADAGKAKGKGKGDDAESAGTMESMLGTLHQFCQLLKAAHKENVAEDEAAKERQRRLEARASSEKWGVSHHSLDGQVSPGSGGGWDQMGPSGQVEGAVLAEAMAARRSGVMGSSTPRPDGDEGFKSEDEGWAE